MPQAATVASRRGPSGRAKKALQALARGTAKGESLRSISAAIGVDAGQLCRWKRKHLSYFLRSLDGYYERSLTRGIPGGTLVRSAIEAELYRLLEAATAVMLDHLEHGSEAAQSSAAMAVLEAANRYGTDGVKELAPLLGDLVKAVRL